MVCEDLHWADPSSLALLEHLLPLTQRVPLLLICLFRPEPDREHAVWRISEAAEQRLATRFLALQLQPLSAGESESLLTNLIGQVLPPKLAWRVLGQAEGNPFYLEEIVRSLIISGALLQDPATHGWRLAHDVAEIAIPETLLSVLSARIDRLDNDQRQVLQMAAVIGRIFPYRVLAAVAGDMADLDQRLKSLVQQELVRPRAGMPELEYIFKHVLTQEAAYNSALKRQRQFYHRQTGEALERLFPERLEEQLGLLAHHWERSDEPSPRHKLPAARRRPGAAGLCREEAADYYQRALDILSQQGDDEASARTLMRLGLVHAAAFDFPGPARPMSRALSFGAGLRRRGNRLICCRRLPSRTGACGASNPRIGIPIRPSTTRSRSSAACWRRATTWRPCRTSPRAGNCWMAGAPTVFHLRDDRALERRPPGDRRRFRVCLEAVAGPGCPADERPPARVGYLHRSAQCRSPARRAAAPRPIIRVRQMTRKRWECEQSIR